MMLCLFPLLAVLTLGFSLASAATLTDGDGSLGASPYWREVERYEREGCRVVDRFARPSFQGGLCVARVHREVFCDDGPSSAQSVLDFAAAPRRGRGCDDLVPERDFSVVSFVRSWEDAPAILDAARRLLERLPREFKRHGLSAEQAHALSEVGLSALQGIDFDIGETFGPNTLCLTFVVEACSCTIVLVMDKNRPRRHAWAQVVE